MHFDRQLNWKKHICSKRKHLELKLSKILLARLKFITDTGKQNITIQNHTNPFGNMVYFGASFKNSNQRLK